MDSLKALPRRLLLPQGFEDLNSLDRYRWRVGLGLVTVLVIGPLVASGIILVGDMAPEVVGWIRIFYAATALGAYLAIVRAKALRALGWLTIFLPPVFVSGLSQSVYGIYAPSIWTLAVLPSVNIFIAGTRLGLVCLTFCEGVVLALFFTHPVGVEGAPRPIEYLAMHIGLSVVLFLIMSICLRALHVLQVERDRELARAVNAERLAGLGILGAGVAHEVNNPLAVIVGASDFLISQMDSGGVGPETLRKHLERINLHAHRIHGIVQTLMRLSRPQVFNNERTDVRKVVEDVMSLQDQFLRQADVTSSVVGLDQTLCVEAGDTDLAQILINLIDNAAYAVRNLEERWIRLSIETSKSGVVFRITDSGRAREVKVDQLFTPFYTTKPVGEGMGLGLSLSRRIAENLGGTLDAGEESGHMCFVLTLPGGPGSP